MLCARVKAHGVTGTCNSGAVGVKASWKLKLCISIFRITVMLISTWVDIIFFTVWLANLLFPYSSSHRLCYTQ